MNAPANIDDVIEASLVRIARELEAIAASVERLQTQIALVHRLRRRQQNESGTRSSSRPVRATWQLMRRAAESAAVGCDRHSRRWLHHGACAVNPLKVSVITTEIAVVASLAVSSYSIAFAGHSSDWGAAAPLAALVAIESMRLPLAFRLPRMRLAGMVCGGAMLAGLSIITGEAASLGFTNLIYQRMRLVAEAERDLAQAQISRDALNSAIAQRAEEISRLQSDVETARKHRASIDQPLTLQPPPAGRTCAGRRGSWNCGAAVQSEAVQANAAAMRAHADELQDASALVKAAETRLAAVQPAPNTSAADASLAGAKRKVADERSTNVMFRAAAAWQRTPVEDLSSESFAAVVHYAVVAIAIAMASSTALAAIIASLLERDGRSGKLAMALRRMIAARRKTLRRLKETVRTEYRDRTIFRYVPTDPVSGRVLDPDRPRNTP